MSWMSTVRMPASMARLTSPTSRGPVKYGGKIVATDIRITISLRRSPYPVVVRRLVPCIVSILLLTACVDEASPPVTSAPTTSSTSTSLTRDTANTPTTTIAEDACPAGDVMLADGGLADFDPPSSDATRIAGIGWRASGDCQLFTISFATEDGAPATTPPALSARLLRTAGVLRVETSATNSVVADQLVESGPVERIFVPVTEEGTRFVDLVLGGPVVARARLQTSPARVEIELQPGGPELI